MSEEEIIERFNREVQLNMRLSRLIQKQYMKEAKEEKQRRIAVEQQHAKNVKDEKQRRFLVEQQNAKEFKEEKQRRFLVEQERDQLRKELKMWKDREQQSKLHSEKLVDQNTHLLQQNNQLQTEMQKLRDEQKTKNMEEAGRQQEQRRSTQQQKPEDTKGGQMQNCQYGNVSGKFVFVSDWTDLPNCLSSDNAENIYFEERNLDSFVHNVSSYKKELLVWTWWKNMYTTNRYANYYANLLSLCQEWKRLRPDGEIHCLYWYVVEEGSSSEPDKELISLLTTCNKYLSTDEASYISAFRQYWPKFAESILSEKTKKKFPK